MIQYDRYMDLKDIVDYWAGGYVLYQATKSSPWVLATVSAPEREEEEDDEECDGLWLTITDAGRWGTHTITVSRDAFFDDVILHRPIINLVEYKGGIYRLRWAPPDRTYNKAICAEALTSELLGVGIEDAPEPIVRKAVPYVEGGVPVLRESGVVMEPQPPRALDLLLAHMNSPARPSSREILHSVAGSRVCRLLTSDEWVCGGGEDNTVCLYVGATMICRLAVNDDGEWDVHGKFEAPKMWIPTVERHLQRRISCD